MPKAKGYAAMSPAFPRKGSKSRSVKKINPNQEGNTPKGARGPSGSTTRSAKAREKRLSKVAM